MNKTIHHLQFDKYRITRYNNTLSKFRRTTVAQKYYAVKAGYIPGIYKSWDDCKKQTDGFSGAIYKSFKTKEEAEAFLGSSTNIPPKKEEENCLSEAIAYVDGSYDDSQKAFAYGVVLFYNGIEKHFARKMSDGNLIDMRNVAGEIKAAECAMQFCLDHNIKSLDIYHDYEGIAKWCTGEWKASKTGTQLYKQFYNDIKDHICIRFFKVKGHSGDKYNDLADQLAKCALFEELEIGEKEMSKSKSVYIDKTSVNDFVINLGRKLWGDEFEFEELAPIGNQHRCKFCVDGTQQILDFYFKNDGSVTLRAVGASSAYSEQLKDEIIANSFKNEHENSACTFSHISDGTYTKLVEYIQSLEKIQLIEDKTIASPAHRHLKFSSSFGDKMVINRYNNGTLVLQGNPAYILSQAMYFMALMPDVSEEEITQRQKDIYQVSTNSVPQARAELKARIPNAYDKLDDTILKILSPAISLSQSNLNVEEYSCYAFPALKALEALLLDLLNQKGISVNPPKQNFGSVFVPGQPQHVLSPANQAKVNDATYQKCLEDIYDYFKKQRHTRFHANQVLVLTTLIFDKAEADAIISDVLAIIDDTAKKIM